MLKSVKGCNTFPLFARLLYKEDGLIFTGDTSEAHGGGNIALAMCQALLDGQPELIFKKRVRMSRLSLCLLSL